MVRISSSIAIGLLSLVGWTAGWAAEELAACRTSTIPIKFRPPVQDLTGPLPIADYLDTIIGCNTAGRLGMGPPPPPRPKSAWLEAEKKLYSDSLAGTKADILVLPFQVQGRGLDRIERMVMAADLAYAIGDAGTMTVADPFLTALAVGENSRRLDMQAVEGFALKLGVKQIVAAYVGHDAHHTFTLTVEVRDTDRGPNGSGQLKKWQHDWRAVPFSDARPPAYVFHDMLQEVLRTLPLKLDATKRPTAPAAQFPASMAMPPLDAVVSNKISPASLLTLLGALAPPGEERARQRLLERALVLALRSKPSNTTTFLESYALMGLDRRPVALARLGKLEAPAFSALQALLNGNLPAARDSTAKVTDSFQQLLLQLELRDLELQYRQESITDPTAAEKLFGAAANSWAPLLAARVGDVDRWNTASALSIKSALDAAFPLQGLDAASLVGGTTTAKATFVDEVSVDIASGRHVRRIASRLEVPTCCHMQELRPTRWDLLWVLQGLSERRFDKSLYRSIAIQAAPQSAIDALNRYEPFFSGHPALAVASAEASGRIAEDSGDDERAPWSERGIRDGLAASWWVQGQGMLGVRAAVSLGMPSPESSFWLDGYGNDYPRRSFWPYYEMGVDPLTAKTHPALMESLAFSRGDLSPYETLYSYSGAQQRRELQASVDARFRGHPKMESRDQPGPGNYLDLPIPERIKALKALAVSDPEKWSPHASLGMTLVQFGGSLEEAQKAFLAYPRFKDLQTRDPVRLASEAHDVASTLYRLGRVDLARPLFDVAAKLGTGSAASMDAEAKLLLIDRRYADAADAMLNLGLRYQSAHAYRDYLSLLHVLGGSTEAWQGFSQVRTQFDVPQVWGAALVGHRMQGLDERAFRAWLKQPEIRDARFRSQLFASWYAVAGLSVDRVPPADLGALVEQLEGPRVARVDEDGSTLRPHPIDPNGFEIVRPSNPPRDPKRRLAQGTLLKSERAYFADAYSAVARGDYEAAITRFDAMTEHYGLNGQPLAYYAYAASKTGDRGGMEQYLHILNPNRLTDFDLLLSRAYFAARKSIPEARKWLDLALRNRGGNDYNPIPTEFQYAQACEWLYRDTQDDHFRQKLLEWVKSYQLVQPIQAWTYTMQYTYEKDPAQRTRALAMARYLDPASPRIQSATKSEVANADAWFKRQNPFAGQRRPDESL